MRTQVGIIGAGPAGLFLAHLLKQQGIDSIVLESRSRAYVEARVRAGVLETGTVEIMERLGLDERLKREGMVDEGIDMRFRGRTIHINLPELAGKSVMIYGQQEIVKDLIAARVAAGDPLIFEAKVTKLSNIDRENPIIHYQHDGVDKTLECDFIAGCDGFHGVSRPALPQNAITTYDHTFNFAWLGVLARARPIADMTYTNSDSGFALCSRRSMEVSRLYLQVPFDEKVENWSDARFWEELHKRMFDYDRSEIVEGEIFQRDVAQLRSFVTAPMHYGRLFLAGDAVHIVPPTGAKGLNLAVADVRVLSGGLTEFYRTGKQNKLDAYSDRCLERVWKTVRYSTRMTELLHKFDEHSPFQRQLQLSELEYIAGSRAAQTTIAEQYAGLPFIDD